MRTIWMAAMSVLLPALVLVGCGGTTKAEYEADMQRVATRVDRSIAELEGSGGDQLRAARSVLEEATDELDGFSPPDEVAKAHKQYVAGLRGMAELLASYEGLKPNKAADQRRVVKLFEQLEGDSSPIAQIERAQEAFREAGYDVFVEGTSGPPGSAAGTGKPAGPARAGTSGGGDTPSGGAAGGTPPASSTAAP